MTGLGTTATLGSSAALGTSMAILGGAAAAIGVFGLLMYILLVIAQWKIFTKAGEAGWKALIPIYNVYIEFKIAKMTKYFWALLIVSFGLGLIGGLIPSIAGVVKVISRLVALVILILHIDRLGNVFGKGLGFKLGLVFLPSIFTLILGFGSAEYTGNATKTK